MNPVLVAAFEGWNDAGDAASGAVEHLAQVWQATEVAALDPEDYYDFQVNRPEVTIDEGGSRQIVWPTTRLSVARVPLATRDVVLLHGIEPSMRWRAFIEEVLGAARDLGVEMIVTLGALLADTPHTRPVPVTGTSTEAAMSTQFGYEPSTYEGPTGIVGVLQEACAARRHPGGLAVGRRPALRRAAAVPEGHAGAARADRGPAGRPGAPR